MVESALVQDFLESLPHGTFVSVESLRAWFGAGLEPGEGGALSVSPADWLSDDERRRWQGSLPRAGWVVSPLPAPVLIV